MELRKIEIVDLEKANQIIIDAIERLKENKIDQWQNGYPNKTVIINDIKNNQAYGMYDGFELVAYAAVVKGVEPYYTQIKEGAWHTSEDYLTIHRMALSSTKVKQGMGFVFLDLIEKEFNKNLRIDTGFDNVAMQKLLKKAEFVYCGIVEVEDGLRMAFDKIPFNRHLC